MFISIQFEDISSTEIIMENQQVTAAKGKSWNALKSALTTEKF